MARDCPGVRALSAWTAARKASLAARAREMRGTVAEAWVWACREIAASDLLSGRTGRTGKYANWKVDADWVLKPANWTKIREGKYRNSARSSPAHHSLSAGAGPSAPCEIPPTVWLALAPADQDRVVRFRNSSGDDEGAVQYARAIIAQSKEAPDG